MCGLATLPPAKNPVLPALTFFTNKGQIHLNQECSFIPGFVDFDISISYLAAGISLNVCVYI